MRGRPPKNKISASYSSKTRDYCRRMWENGLSYQAITNETKICRSTLYYWKKCDRWTRKNADSRDNILEQIRYLSESSGEISEAAARKLSLLTKALAVLERDEKKQQKKAKSKPQITIEMIGDLATKVAEYPLRPYQRRFVDDTSRYRCMLKGRQVGISWTLAFDMILNGLTRNIDQNLISTSIEQCENTIRYARAHMQALGIEDVGYGSKKEIVLPNGKIIRALPSGHRTNQGWPGDCYFDEFAWYMHTKKTWEAVVPSVTAVKGRVTVVSTPYEAGPHNYFWRIATNDGDEFPNFSRHAIDIESAVKEGLEIDLTELRSLFDSDTWDRLYMCKFFTDEDSFFTLGELNECRGACIEQWTAKSQDRRAGWDMAKTTDASELVAVEKLSTQVFVRGIETWKRIPYQVQGERLVDAVRRWRIRELHIDVTGVGIAVRDFLFPKIPAHIDQHWHTFTQTFKAGLAQNLKRLIEQQQIVIPHDDQILISQFLSIKRSATQTGIAYDIPRNSTGHGDRFWALALACEGIEFGNTEINSIDIY